MDAEFQPNVEKKVYTCHLTVISSAQKFIVENIGGDQLWNETELNVEGLNVTNQMLTNIPSKINNFFPNISAINWVNTSLETIAARDLQQFPKLKTMIVYKNKLLSLCGDLFIYTSKLQWLDLSNNSIDSVGLGILSSLSKLKFANFQDNLCISFEASSDDGMRELKKYLAECAPSAIMTTVEPQSECSGGCAGRIESLEDKVIEQNEVISQLRERINKLENQYSSRSP